MRDDGEPLAGQRPRDAALRLAGAEGQFDGLPVNRRGIPISTNPDQSGKPVRSFVLPDLCPSEGLTQNWNSSHIQYNNGRNNGFVRNVNSPTPMGYFTKPQMPVTYALAAHFPVSDRFFCSLLGQTLPNRRYYFSGTSSGQVNDDNSSLLVSAANGTIFDRLDAAKVSWHVYYGNVPSPAYFPNVRNNPLQVVKLRQEPAVLHRRGEREAAGGLLRGGGLQLPVRGEPPGRRLRGDVLARMWSRP